MISPSPKRRTSREPTMSFQMSTRRRTSQASILSTSDTSSSPPELGFSPRDGSLESNLSSSQNGPTTLPQLNASESPRRITTKLRLSSSPAGSSSTTQLESSNKPTLEFQSSISSADSSPLSAPPSLLSITPKGLADVNVTRKRASLRQTSPTGRSGLQRAAKSQTPKYMEENVVSKKCKSSSDEDFSGERPVVSTLSKKRRPSPEPAAEPLTEKISARPSRKLISVFVSSLSNEVITPSRKRVKIEKLSTVNSTPSSSPPSNNEPASVGKKAAEAKPSPKAKKQKLFDRELFDREIFDSIGTKEKLTWPEYTAQKPTYYAADGENQYNPDIQPANTGNGSTLKPAGRGRGSRGGHGGSGGSGRGGKGGGHGRGKGKSRGRKDDDGELPRSPPTEEQQSYIRLLRERQAELKKFYTVVGNQQVDILNSMVDRDLSKLVRKSKAHKQVPEYDDLVQDLENKKQDAIDLAETRLVLQRKLAEDEFAQHTELLEMQYKTFAEQVRKEHLAGVEGDLIKLMEAKSAAQDDTHTEVDDDEYFPRYNDRPKEKERVRGYTSRRITDETAFKNHLASYDDQVRREVIDDDILAPVAKAVEEANKRYREARDRAETQNVGALSKEAAQQLLKIKGYPIPRRLGSSDYNAWALSALAEISEYHATKNPQNMHTYMPLAQGEHFPKEALSYDRLPGQSKPPIQPVPQQKQSAPPSTPGNRVYQFQPPQGTSHLPRPAMAPTTGRFGVTFVNQTPASRKASGAGKGQRVLLPKM